MTDFIETTLEAGVLSVRVNRPEKKNALTHDMYSALADAIERAESDPAVRVLLFSGAGGTFTAGNDIGDFLENPPHSEDAPVNRFIAGISSTDVPIVAAVEGIAVGIGTTMLLHFDRVFATPGTRFSLPFINLALVPEAGSSQLLVQACGYQRAAGILMMGEPFSGADALEYGIACELCEPGDLLARARDEAKRLAAKPKAALRATKRLLRRTAEPIPDRISAEMNLFGERLASPAAKEAFTAFLEKRAPDFSLFD